LTHKAFLAVINGSPDASRAAKKQPEKMTPALVAGERR
jgi:hypothetical protein